MREIESVNVRAIISGDAEVLRKLTLNKWVCYDFKENSDGDAIMRADVLLSTDGVPAPQAVTYAMENAPKINTENNPIEVKLWVEESIDINYGREDL